MRNSKPVLIFAALVAALAHPAAAIQIDNFEEMNFTFTDDVTGLTGIGATFGENSGIQSANTWGGVRLVRIIASSDGTLTGAAVGTAALATTPIDDGAALSVVGAPEAHANYEFIYDGVANGEPDGRFGTLGLDLTPATSIDISATHLNAVATAQLVLSTSATSQLSAEVPLANGITSFALAAFNILDLSDITQVRVLISGIDLGEAVVLNYIATSPDIVPEPGTGLLLALGLAGVAFRRRVQ